MQCEEVKVINVTAQPIGSTTENLQQCMQSTAQVMSETLNSLEGETSKEKEAKGFLNNFKSYIQSANFKQDVNDVAKKYGVPPKKVAQNFFEKALGTVGDILGIAINVVCNAGRMVINIASTVANSIINLIHSIASGIASIVTLNRTCVTN